MRTVRRQLESLRREVVDGSERLELLMLRLMDSRGEKRGQENVR